MNILIAILLAFLIGIPLIKGWVLVVNSVFNPLIARLDKKPYINKFVLKHHRIIKGREKAKDLQKSFNKGGKELMNEYNEYLKWCEENKINPVVTSPDGGKLNSMHLS